MRISISIDNVWYHGSPYSGIEFNKNILTFFTKSLEVARQYAIGKVAFTGKDLGGRKTPTIYTVTIQSTKIFDMRTQRNEYSALREKAKESLFKTPLFMDGNDPDRLPRLDSEGFIHSHTGLPGYGRVKQFQALLANYDGMYVDEGPQGISLVIFNPKGLISVISTKEVE